MDKQLHAWDWATDSPERHGLSPDQLEALWSDLARRDTRAFLVVRDDRIVFERYASGSSRNTPQGTASLAKALVGGVSLMLAMDENRISPDDPASRYVPQWATDPHKKRITVRHLATHTSGIEDAEADGTPHEALSGWKGEFWRRLDPPHDPFTLSRDRAPVLDPPGTTARYSNPGMAMLGYCVTASLKGGVDADLRALIGHRIMEPLGVHGSEWTVGYGRTFDVEGLPLVATWGGGSYSPDASVRIGRLLLHAGSWNGRQLIARSVVQAATTYAGAPNASGLGWWVNRRPGGGPVWNDVPVDAFWGSGAGQQFLLVLPSENLILVRNGGLMDRTAGFNEGLERFIAAPMMRAIVGDRTGTAESHAAPYPASPVIQAIEWAPKKTIHRQANDSDCWPLTWGDDGALYTAYGDGFGFDPHVPEKLSLGLAKVTGTPPDIIGTNLRAPSIEQKGGGARGRKASGILMVRGILYLWVRNADNAQLAWSADRGGTWAWSAWRFSTSFGCPAFLNYGKNYSGARDGYVYSFSPDSDSAYLPADRMVLARVPEDRVLDRDDYDFFQRLSENGDPVWTKAIDQRGAVFSHRGGCLRSQVTYNPGIGRYLWWQQVPNAGKVADRADSRFAGGFGVYDAPEPWGPWTTAYFTHRWDVGPGETGSFPAKWMSEDGKTAYLVFSGDDNFSVRKATLVV